TAKARRPRFTRASGGTSASSAGAGAAGRPATWRGPGGVVRRGPRLTLGEGVLPERAACRGPGRVGPEDIPGKLRVPVTGTQTSPVGFHVPETWPRRRCQIGS